MSDSLAQLNSAVQALEADDLAGASFARTHLQLDMSSIDLVTLGFVSPAEPAQGFRATLAQLVAAGYTQTPDDVAFGSVITQVLRGCDSLISSVEALTPPNITDAQISALHAQAQDLDLLVNQLAAISPSPYGVTANIDALTALLTHELPQLTQLLDQLAVQAMDAAGIPPLTVVADATGSYAGMQAPEPQIGLLFDLLGLTTEETFETEVALEIYRPAIADITHMLAAEIIANVIQPYGGSQLCGVVSSGWLSGVAPGIPGSFIEGEPFSPILSNNHTLFIGPELGAAVTDPILTAIDAWSIGTPQNIDDLYNLLMDLFNLLQAPSVSSTAMQHAFTQPSSVTKGDGVLCPDFNGDDLWFDQGFPDVLGNCFVCISNVTVVYWDQVDATLSKFTTVMAK